MGRTIALGLSWTIAALGVPAAASAQGPPSPKPLRTLVYSIAYGSSSVSEEKTSGFYGGGNSTSTGSAAVKRVANVDDSGTLTANVIAATGDGGLVIQTSFAGKTTSQPPINVAVYPEGRLGFANGAELSPEAARVLPLLARGIVAGRTIEPGSSWIIPASAPLKGAYTYHVADVSGDVVTFAIDIEMAMPGPQGFDERGKATAIYDTAKLCPTRLDYTGTSRHQPAIDQYVTTTAHLSATLVSDTFPKK